MPMSGDAIFWIAALIVFIIVEAMTVGLASIWFAIGAVAALICALLHGPVWLQVVWFLAVSVATLVLTRPLVKKYMRGKSVPTNADRNIGRTAAVTERIDNLAGIRQPRLQRIKIRRLGTPELRVLDSHSVLTDNLVGYTHVSPLERVTSTSVDKG